MFGVVEGHLVDLGGILFPPSFSPAYSSFPPSISSFRKKALGSEIMAPRTLGEASGGEGDLRPRN